MLATALHQTYIESAVPRFVLRKTVMDIMLIILVLFFFFGGGGYYGYRRWR